ncbi:hypothetical protein EB796_015414 [Bugula neritina]|uniref:Uncharacterized protein n=1 Tax=Bugula neritina TaxID=10212 RepID=A0A7J7JLM5_BUGNE|nr:hypothetical protein EB796_015414 [Bugula neritina]
MRKPPFHGNHSLQSNGQFLQIDIIDTAAWNEFAAMQSLFVKRAHLVLVVYDVTSPSWRKSLQNIIKGVRDIKADADIVVIGNKCDKLKKGA